MPQLMLRLTLALSMLVTASSMVFDVSVPGRRHAAPSLRTKDLAPFKSRHAVAVCIIICMCTVQDHPGITSLDLSHNPIADRGGLALVRLLEVGSGSWGGRCMHTNT